MKKLLFIAFIAFASIHISQAQDRVFTYTYQTNVLNKGDREIEVWNTIHWGKADFYRAFKHRVEYELGLGSNLQTAFYLNLTTSSQKEGADIISGSEINFSNEWKYKLSDATANSIGSALYAEVEIGKENVEFEGKLLLDKNIGKSSHALNLVGAIEHVKGTENGNLITEKETTFAAYYGFSHKVGENLNLGFEARETNAIKDGDIEFATLFAGPGLSYYGDKYWINFTLFPQIYSFKGATQGHLNLDGHEKIETRLLFSFQL